jgi:hypothetical protein
MLRSRPNAHQRLLASGVLTPDQRAALETLYRTLNPVTLRTQLDEALRRVWQPADRPPAEERPLTIDHGGRGGGN